MNFLLLTLQIFSVLLDFIQRIGNCFDNWIIGSNTQQASPLPLPFGFLISDWVLFWQKWKHMLNVITYWFPWPMVWRCFIPNMQFSNHFVLNLFWVTILWIKSSWTAKICHVNKRKWVWYDAQMLAIKGDVRTRRSVMPLDF